MPKKILLINRCAPYGNSTARDAIDTALAAAVYDQEISILFIDDGIFQLLKSQNSASIDQKNVSSALSALPLYDIENIYVHYESLAERAITPDELILDDVKLLDNRSVGNLFDQYDHLLSF